MAKGVLILLFTLTLVLSVATVYCTEDTVESAKQQASDVAEYVKDKAQDMPEAARTAFDDVTGTIKESTANAADGSWLDYFRSYLGAFPSGPKKEETNSPAPSPAPVAA